MLNFKAYLQLMRPANIITAIADILLGYAASGAVLHFFEQGNMDVTLANPGTLLWLILATIGLYGGGVVFNDVFDAGLDAVERPERPIPSGRASLRGGVVLGALLLGVGVWSAFHATYFSGFIAVIIVLLSLLYDAWGKNQNIFGPINMGACRGANLLLGVSALPAMVTDVWFLALVPVIYIAAITMVSRGEVHGGNPAAIRFAGGLYAAVFIAIISLTFLPHYNFLNTLPFLLLFGYMIFPPLVKAFKSLQPAMIGKAVKAGVIALIVMDATIAAGFAGWAYGLMVLLLLPVSISLGRIFSVT